MLNSLANNSMKQYDTALKSWWYFCEQQKISPYEAPVPNILTFLNEKFNNGAINSTRSALSLIIGQQVGNDERIKRFIKGVFRSKPPRPKYNFTWDPGLVLNHVALWYPHVDISLEKLTKKLVTILALTTGHRVQTLSLIKLNNIKVVHQGIQIHIPDIIKTTKRGALQPMLHLKTYNNKIEICPVHIIRSYINITQSIRKDIQNLIITYKKPHKNASCQTISRWTKTTIEEAGIDMTSFTAHSTRHASTSAAKRSGLNIEDIRKTAGWSQNSETFARFYNRPVINDPSSFSTVVCQTIENYI
ncbi:uncharacterized protein LOC113229329 [Hyposmocoma kahamanoa]|uniref:uncharacterized protein LOC113229329 n=1 Tax=Hyposmocoma kahamanoa TaxID=1477025 RepID=UPI000E6D62D0|nr:uncharacterized protein LOC113229329 [Hyposmocoma kahamanoa]